MAKWLEKLPKRAEKSTHSVNLTAPAPPKASRFFISDSNSCPRSPVSSHRTIGLSSVGWRPCTAPLARTLKTRSNTPVTTEITASSSLEGFASQICINFPGRRAAGYKQAVAGGRVARKEHKQVVQSRLVGSKRRERTRERGGLGGFNQAKLLPDTWYSVHVSFVFEMKNNDFE